MGAQSALTDFKLRVRHIPWLFRILKTGKNALETSPLYPALLRLACKTFPSWVGLRARLANDMAANGDREGSLKLARDLAALPDTSHDLLISIQPIFHLQGQPKEGSDILKRAERLRLDANESLQLDQLGLRFFSPNVFHNIGHLALIDSFLKAEKLGLLPTCHNIMVGPMKEYSNPAYARMWGEQMTLIEDPTTLSMLTPLINRLEQHLGMITLADGTMKDHVPFLRDVSLNWPQENSALLSLSDEHKARGRQRLRSLGIPDDAWFVGLHVRQGGDGMRGLRDADINSYHLAVGEIHKRGGWVIRMGDASMPEMAPVPGAVDYVHTDLHADWMDVFLWAEGKFFIGTGSGPCVVPTTFDKPVVITNWVPLGNRMPGREDLLLPKQMRHRSNGQYLTMEERIGPDVAYIESRAALNALNIDIIDNDADEIQAAVIEMLERLDGTAQYSDNHTALQARSDHWAAQVAAAPTRMARVFLDKYSDLF